MTGKFKRIKRQLPVASPSTTAVDLFLLAGIPHALQTAIAAFLENLAGAHSKVIAASSPSFDGLLYREKTVQTLLTAAAQFAVRRLKNRSDDQAARPRRIALFYVPAADDELLLRAFDFFVFPIPLRGLSVFNNAGKQRRHQREECEAEIRRGMDVCVRDLIGSVQRRVESRKSQEPLLLPPMNFHIADQRLKQAFRELTRSARAWENAMPELFVAQQFDREKLPSFLAVKEHQMIFQDSRKSFSLAPGRQSFMAFRRLIQLPTFSFFVSFCGVPIDLERRCRKVFIMTLSSRTAATSIKWSLIAREREA
ncbi:MAG: hypothetical protein M3Y57_06970 [Acidobacteriota bacterium]|nr:hypothetical protein [Acidobacteriota bacterium]